MQNAYLVSTATSARDFVATTLQGFDNGAIIKKMPNPCLFSTLTVLDDAKVKTIAGVCHVIRLENAMRVRPH